MQSGAAPESRRFAVRDWFVATVVRGSPPALGLVLLVLAWQGITTATPVLPTPAVTWKATVALFAGPFYRNGPNDQGVGRNMLAPLAYVGAGFDMAAVIDIPAGFLVGRFVFLNAMASSIINLLWSASPLAQLPIGLLLFKSANPAAIRAIFICSIWPMVINTAVGVTCVPQDYLNVARALNLFEWKVFTRMLSPVVLPHMLTGVRLFIGTAWLVIAATEMLTGSVGIGFRLWDKRNNLKVERTVIAVFVIGVVGLLLKYALPAITRRFSYDAVRAK